MAKLKFLQHYGLKTTGVGLAEWAGMPEDERGQAAEYLAEHDMALTLGVHADWHADKDDLKRRQEQLASWLERFAGAARAPICTTSGAGIHRFCEDPPLAAQLDALAEGLAPLALVCEALQCPLAIENHGDYYVSDLVELCERTPGLGIFLDTGNTFLIGEKPLDAARVAAPHVRGTHFKDQRVRPMPTASPLHFEVANAAPGQGDVPLREIYTLLKSQSSRWSTMTMQIEMFPKDYGGPGAIQEFEQALEFIRSLEEAA